MSVLFQAARSQKDLVIPRRKLSSHKLDIGGRDLVVGFNEPAFRFSKKHLAEADLDAKLNARLPSYFLPLVVVAQKQSRRPHMFVSSGLNMALKWNANTERQRVIMMINNYLKFDFLRTFFDTFFPETFSVIEYVVAQDPVKITDEKMLALWKILERRYPKQVKELKLALAKYTRPRLFGDKRLSPEAHAYLNSQHEDLLNAFKYAVGHLFVMADINFEGNYILNPVGYLTVGGPSEKIFNIVRELALQVLDGIAELVFERDVIIKDNIRLILDSASPAPVPYGGNFRKWGDRQELAEVTYENGADLEFYDKYDRLKPDMEYIYELIHKEDYRKFWFDYRERYFELKRRYREAYQLAEDF